MLSTQTHGVRALQVRQVLFSREDRGLGAGGEGVCSRRSRVCLGKVHVVKDTKQQSLKVLLAILVLGPGRIFLSLMGS